MGKIRFWTNRGWRSSGSLGGGPNTVTMGDLYQGVIDCSSNPNYPAADKNMYWNVGGPGKVGGASGIDVEVGDVITCITANNGGTYADVGTKFLITQFNIDPATVTEIRTGTSDAVYVTPNVLADQLNGGSAVFSAATLISLGGGTTQQLLLTSTAAQKALAIASTVQTVDSVTATVTVNSANYDFMDVTITPSTALSGGEMVSGTNFAITSAAADANASYYIGHNIALISTALSQTDMIGMRITHSGSVTATGGTVDLVGVRITPTATLNTGGGVANFYGIDIDMTGLTCTVSNDVYGINILHNGSSDADASLWASDGTNVVTICNNSVGIRVATGSAITTIGGLVQLDISGPLVQHAIYVHTTSIADGYRAIKLGAWGTELEVKGGEGLTRSYTKTTTGTGATAIKFDWGYNTVAAVGIIGAQEQYESQVTAVGSVSLMGRDVIVGVAAGKFMATTGGDMTQGLIGGRFKVYSDASSTTNGSVACLWLDSQMSSAVVESEYSIRASTGGSVPDAFIGFVTTSAGWANLLHFNTEMAPLDGTFTGNGGFVSANKGTFTLSGGIKILVGSTQCWIPYGVLSN